MALKATIYKAAVNVAERIATSFWMLTDAGAAPVGNPGAHDAAPAGVDQICR